MLQALKRIAPDSAAAYVFASILVALAALLRWATSPFGPDVLPFVTFFPATLFAGFVGGFRPGLYAAILGGIVGWWAFLPPLYDFFPLTPGAVAGLFAYAFTSLAIVWGADHHRLLIKRLHDEEDFRQMVVQELGHRLKNKVATIQSIIGYQLRDNPQLKDVINQRLSALSATDDLIMAAEGKGAYIDDIVSTELGPYERSRMVIEGPRIMLHPRLALSIALVVHELATNAAKHGALSCPTGRISVRWRVSADSEKARAQPPLKLNLDWQESGGPAVFPPANRGFGLRLLAVALEQFSGRVEPVFEQAGFVCRMSVPVPPDTLPLRGQQHEKFLLGEQSGQSLTPGHRFTHA